MFQDRFELVRSDREIEKAIAARAPFVVDLVQAFGETFETGFVAEIALMIKDRLAEHFPDLVANGLAREFSDRLFHFFPEVVITLGTTGETDHVDSGR